MKQRCLNPKNHAYPRYGGRGIAICARWLHFEGFLEDMGERPSVGHSIDRIDNARGYEPGNCRWATSGEQSLNRSVTIWVTHNGTRVRLRDLAARMNVDPVLVGQRLNNGWSLERALKPPKNEPAFLRWRIVGGQVGELRMSKVVTSKESRDA